MMLCACSPRPRPGGLLEHVQQVVHLLWVRSTYPTACQRPDETSRRLTKRR